MVNWVDARYGYCAFHVGGLVFFNYSTNYGYAWQPEAYPVSSSVNALICSGFSPVLNQRGNTMTAVWSDARDGFADIYARTAIFPKLQLVGEPKAGRVVFFALTDGTASDEGKQALVVLSKTGLGNVTGGIVMPGSGGRVLGIDPDALTQLSLHLPVLSLTSPIQGGKAVTTSFPFPSGLSGQRFYAAAVVVDPIQGKAGSITNTIEIVGQ
jgi:hypothetical protein